MSMMRGVMWVQFAELKRLYERFPLVASIEPLRFDNIRSYGPKLMLRSFSDPWVWTDGGAVGQHVESTRLKSN